MEIQFAKYEDLVGQIALHPDGGAMTEKSTIVKFMAKFPTERTHWYTQELRDQKKRVSDTAVALNYLEFKESIMVVW